jgi:predicted amidohydrolase YtcJ
MTEPAPILFENARVFTADPANPMVEAVVVSGDQILFAGSRVEASAWKSRGARVIDAGGGTLMPGFIDSHYHLLLGALSLDGIQFGEAFTFEQVSGLVHTYAAAHPADDWLHGSGLRYNIGPGQTPLDRHVLDGISADRPLYVSAYDGHTAWANTRALELAGILGGTDCGPNGEIVMGDDGRATGELREGAAFDLVSRLIPQPDEERQRDLLRQALRLTASVGVTSVHNMDGSPEQAAFFSALEAAQELTCRVYMPINTVFTMPVESVSKAHAALKDAIAPGSAMVRAGAVKFFADGVIESYTALVIDPYADRPNFRGRVSFPIHAYTRLVREADRLGLQVFTHAVGDLSVRLALSAYESALKSNGRRDSRHRIEHIELIQPADAVQFKALGVIASMQPLHAPASTADGDVWLERVPRARWADSFAWQTLRSAGAPLVFGSDWPVVVPDPLAGLHNALNRHAWAEGLPNHRQDLAEALLSYTREAAYAEFQEHCKGQVKAGYAADLVLLSADLFAVPAAEINQVKPVLTMVDGRVVYSA